MSVLPMVLMAVGTTLTAAAAIKEGKAISSAYKASARLSEISAGQITQAGAYEAAKIAREKKRMLGRQKALYAKSGVLLSEGSPLEVMADTAAEYEMDIVATRYNASIEAMKARYTSEVYRSQAKTAKQLGYIGAAGTLLTAAGSAGFSKGAPGLKKASGGGYYTGQTMNYGGKTYKITTP